MESEEEVEEAHSPVLVDELLHEEQSEYQHLVVFRSDAYGMCLSLDGVLQSTERDEQVYHRRLAAVPLLLCGARRARRVLICGGGNGAAAREVLNFPEVEEVVLIEIDPAVTRVARSFLGKQAEVLSDGRVKLIFADAADFARWPEGCFDVIIVDSTDIGATAGRSEGLWSQSFFKGCLSRLRGYLSCQLGACVASTSGLAWSSSVLHGLRNLRAAGFQAEVYTAEIPSYGGLALFGIARPKAEGAGSIAGQLDKVRLAGDELDLSASFLLPAPLAKELDDGASSLGSDGAI